MKPVISIVGLGKLGLPFSICWADRGYTVIGADVNNQRISRLQEGHLDTQEPYVAEMFNQCRERLSFTTDIAQAAAASDVVFIFVGTPGEPSGKFTTQYVLSACSAIGSALRQRTTRPLIVLVSSVTAGSIEQEVLPHLEAVSGKKAGQDFDFVYSPVFIALGTMVRDYREPNLTLIGENNSTGGDQLLELLANFYDKKDVPTVRTNYVNAELIKLALSTFVTTKISYANMLMQLCSKLPGSDVDVVSHAIGLDPRVSPLVIRGGGSFGGPCFPRDNRALLYLTRTYQIDDSIVTATDRFNKNLPDWLADTALKHLPAGGAIGILGFAFKTKTDVVEESFGLELAQALLRRQITVMGYDPVAATNAQAVLPSHVTVTSHLLDIITACSTFIIGTPWSDLEALPLLLRHTSDQKTIIDPWRMFPAGAFPSHIHYIRIGTAPASTSLTASVH